MSNISKYREMGSPDKKTGQLKYYIVTRDVTTNRFSCTCPAQDFRRFQDCKHIKRLKEKMRWN